MTSPQELNQAFQQALADISRGYRAVEKYGPPVEQRRPSDTVRQVRKEISTVRRALRIAKMLKKGSDDVDDSLDLAFLQAREPARGDPALGNPTYTQTPVIVDADRLRETSREANQDGRSTSTFFDEFERELEQDPVENPIPDQVVGPTGRYAQKGASKSAYFSDARRAEETPQRNVTYRPPMATNEGGGQSGLDTGFDEFAREQQLNESKSMWSSFADFPHGKTAMLDAAFKIAALKYRPRVEVLIVDDQKRVLAGRSPSGNVIFPGGGIEGEETPVAAAKRETLEEVGRRIARPRALHGPVRVKWTPQAKKDQKGDQNYTGSETTYLVARAAAKDRYLHGADGGYKMRARFRPVDALLSDLKRTAATGHPYADYDRAAIDALKKLKKRLNTSQQTRNKDIDEALYRVQNGPADLDAAFKEASRSGGHGAFDDRMTSTEEATEKTWSRRHHDPYKEEEWRDRSRSRNVEQALREFDAPQTQEPANFESFPAGGL